MYTLLTAALSLRYRYAFEAPASPSRQTIGSTMSLRLDFCSSCYCCWHHMVGSTTMGDRVDLEDVFYNG